MPSRKPSKKSSKKRSEDMLSDEAYVKKLNHIRQHVVYLWEGNRGLPPRYTPHDDRHSQCVEDAIRKLIPGDRLSQLSQEEWFYLLASAWLHDVGMIPKLSKKEGTEDNYEEIRQGHHRKSKEYIEEQYKDLGLDWNQATVIGDICLYHRRSEEISNCPEEFGRIRVRLLAAYLRLADAIHIDKTRVDESLFNIFLATGMTWESKYHWLRSFWIEEVLPDFDKLTITVQLLISPDDAENVDVIRNIVEEEVRAELHSVRDILIRGGISYFLDVETKLGPGILMEHRVELEQIISNIQIERKPSASDVIATIVDTILHILNLPSSREAYSTIKRYQGEIIQSIVENRPCHILAKKVNAFVGARVREDAKDLSGDEIERRVKRMKAKIRRFKEAREDRLKMLQTFTKSILADYGSILLFGYSTLVIKSLEAVEDGIVENGIKKKTTIYVCLGGNRSQYSGTNELTYCDGIEYASQIRRIGYDEVYVVPDILVGNLISRPLVSKVIFGANGVDVESGRFGHTAGHLTIADLAHLYRIPVYVIVDSYKFGVMDHKPELERDTPWITGDGKALSKLEGVKRFNPREDTVDGDRLYALVTDHGIFPPNKIPDKIRRHARAGITPQRS